MNQKRKPKDHRKNKRAFDSVMSHLRKCSTSTLGASKLPGSSGKSSPNPVKPSVIDFRADVMKAVTARLPKDISLEKFVEAYVDFDTEDDIEREVHAQKILHDRRHSAEQRCGDEFILRGIYPVNRYFTSVRGEVTYARSQKN
jgi:hypothetical protein